MYWKVCEKKIGRDFGKHVKILNEKYIERLLCIHIESILEKRLYGN